MMSALTCFLCWLPFSSSAFLGGSSRASLTVRSSREGIGRNCHRPLFLVSETTAFVAAAVAEVMRDDSGFMDFFRNGGADVVTITGIVCLLNTNLGDRITSSMDASVGEVKASIVELSAKTEVGMGEVKVSMVELASEIKLNNEKLATELKLNNEKLCGEVKISNEKLYSKTEASSLGELSGEIKALRSDTNASIGVLRSDIGNDIRKLDQKIYNTNAKLDTEIGNLKNEINAMKMNLERSKADFGSLMNITRDAQVEPDT